MESPQGSSSRGNSKNYGDKMLTNKKEKITLHKRAMINDKSDIFIGLI